MRDVRSEIPLLSGRPLSAFTAEEFKKHVTSLYKKREPKKSAPKAKRPFTWSRNKKGTLVLRVSRNPKWLTQEEYELIAKESGEPLSSLFITLKKREIKISTQEREDKIKLALADRPF